MKIGVLSPDHLFYKKMKKGFSRYNPDKEYEIISYSFSNIEGIQKNISKITKDSLDIILVDYSQEEKFLLDITTSLKFLVKMNLVVGLWNQTVDYDKINHLGHTGIKLHFLKGGEIRPVVVGISKYLDENYSFPESAKAILPAGLKYNLSARIPFKMNFLTPTYIHTEHPIDFKEFKGEIAFKDITIDLKKVRTNESNFYYGYKYSSDYEISKEEDRDRMSCWFNNCKVEDLAKRTRVLVLSDNFNWLENCNRSLEDCKFSIRLSSFVNEQLINRVYPGLIVIDSANDDLNVEAILNSVKKTKLKPFIIVFNSDRKDYSYEYILYDNNGFDLEKVILLADKYEKSEARQKTHPTNFGSSEPRIYFDKNNRDGDVYYNCKLTLKELTEDYVKFDSEKKIPRGTIIVLGNPFSCTITVTEEGFGVVHSVNDLEKANLRNFVNKLIQYVESPPEDEDKEDKSA